MAYIYDYIEKYIYVPEGQTTVDILGLLSSIRDAEASQVGVLYPQIASASGNESLGGGVSVGVTLNLLGWQLKFPDSPNSGYTVKIYGGNLVGGINGNTIAYSDGVQVIIVQSASATTITQSTGSGLSAEQDAILRSVQAAATAANLNAQESKTQASLARKMQTNKAVVSGDGLSVIIYEDDGTTPLWAFSISSNKLTRIPQ